MGAAAGYDELDPIVELDSILETKKLMNATQATW